MSSLWERDHGMTLFSGHRERVNSVAPLPGPFAMHKAAAANTEGEMGTTMGPFPPGQSPRASHFLSCWFRPVEFLDELGDSSHGELNFSIGAQDEDELHL